MGTTIDNLRVTGTFRHANSVSPNLARSNIAQQSEEEFAIPLETCLQNRGKGNGAGIGITTGADNFVESVEKIGSIIKTTYIIDVDGCNSGANANDVIGKADTANCTLGQITAIRNGTIFAGQMTCIETPAGGDDDIDLWDAESALLTEDTDIEDDAGAEDQLTNGGNLTAGTVVALTAYPTANRYLYLAAGTGDVNDTYTAGILKIELYGTDSTADLSVVRGTFGTNAIELQTEDLKKHGSQTRVARFTVQLPPEYVAGETVKIRVVGGMITTVADTSCTVDVNCYLNDEDNSVSSDLCTTSATTINTLLSASATTVDFTITAATLTPGAVLDVRVSIICNDAAETTAVIGAITKVALLCDTQG